MLCLQQNHVPAAFMYQLPLLPRHTLRQLAVDESNPQNLAFWQKCAFALTGEKCGPAFRYLPMERQLTGYSKRSVL